jgi:formamidopyrimidine-DNA glycosylase
MPELPEVEHARRYFLSLAASKTIADAGSDDPIVVAQDPAQWKSALLGRAVLGAERVGKNVLVRLSGGNALWFHLGMTGRVTRAPAEGELARFTRWWVRVDDATRICLADGRRLGRSLAGPEDEVRRGAKLAELGPDALEVRTGEALRAAIGAARGPIKGALMDQARIAGIGNIQAAEALWLAKIHPETPITALKSDAWERLARAIGESLERAIASMEGEDEIVYVESGGPNPFRVYDREGEPCPRCGARLVREVARGRASFLCRKCQRRPSKSRAKRT